MTREPHTSHCSASGDAPRSVTSGTPGADPGRATLMNRIVAEAASGRYDRALALAADQADHDPQITNAQGVCLLRLGRVREAVALYRCLLHSPGSASAQSDTPAYLKLNYATALLLSGQPEACLAALQEVDGRNTIARLLRDAIQRWETSLTFSQKLDWWINRVAPSSSPVPIDFAPGEFGPVEMPVLPSASLVLSAPPSAATCDTAQSPAHS